jgi:ankyrin repeat protein
MRVSTRGVFGAIVLLSAVSTGAVESEHALIDAVRSGDPVAARALVQAGANVNEPQADGTTALHWAARADAPELVALLLGAGAQADVTNRYGVTPLLLAAATERGRAVRLLVEAGADPNLSMPEGETPLMTAARTGAADSLRVLLEHGAEVNRREKWFGETALMWAAAENHADAVEVLVAHGAELDARAEIVELPKVKVDNATMVITALPRGGLTPLLLAAREGAVEAASALAGAGADLNLADPDGTSPLVMAIINAHYDVAAVLVERGADAAVADTAGMGAVYALVDMRTQGFMINRPLPTPTGSIDSAALLDRMLERGADPDLPLATPLLARQHSFGDGALSKGSTALMRAAKSGDLAAMRLLLAHGADPARASGDGSTAAMFAARRGGRPRMSAEDAIAAIRLCLDAGADINAGDTTGHTLLHIAVGSGDELVRMLVESGADLAARDSAGRTALDVALGTPGPPVAGRGGRSVAPPPGPVRESTAALLREQMRDRGIPTDADSAEIPASR